MRERMLPWLEVGLKDVVPSSTQAPAARQSADNPCEASAKQSCCGTTGTTTDAICVCQWG
jgi:hypothetical protein